LVATEWNGKNDIAVVREDEKVSDIAARERVTCCAI
jgi:hypothetical protein